jgi:hypothetical protein
VLRFSWEESLKDATTKLKQGSCKSISKEKKIMLREVNPVAARRSRRSLRKPETALPATCLLCRVLWPIVVQHRHLLFDCSSEAKATVPTKMKFR